jgi:hypothetical protein
MLVGSSLGAGRSPLTLRGAAPEWRAPVPSACAIVGAFSVIGVHQDELVTCAGDRDEERSAFFVIRLEASFLSAR